MDKNLGFRLMKETNEIRDLLKRKKFDFTFNNEDDRIHFFEIFVGSLEGNIQIEYSDDGSPPTIQLFSAVDDYGESIYHSIITYDNDFFENDFDEFISSLKEQIKIIANIRGYVDKINELSEELGVEPDRFITINYNF